MSEPGQDNKQENFCLQTLSLSISPLRLGTYLNSAGHDNDRALRLYLWNAQIGEAFHIPIQSVEVGLRNHVSEGLAAEFGPEWWKKDKFLDVAEPRRGDDISVVLDRLTSKAIPHNTGQVIAGLSFGFWVAMLHKRYHPTIWSSRFRPAFPNLPAGITRAKLYENVHLIADLRNRIWHHEPIFKRNLSQDHSRCMSVVQWLCPMKARWIKPHCRFTKLIREKP